MSFLSLRKFSLQVCLFVLIRIMAPTLRHVMPLCCRSIISDTLVYAQIHLFDIDIPGKITFIESKSLTAGETPTIVDTGLMFLLFYNNLFPFPKLFISRRDSTGLYISYLYVFYDLFKFLLSKILRCFYFLNPINETSRMVLLLSTWAF